MCRIAFAFFVLIQANFLFASFPEELDDFDFSSQNEDRGLSKANSLSSEIFSKKGSPAARIRINSLNVRGRVQTFNLFETNFNSVPAYEQNNFRWVRGALAYDSKNAFPLRQVLLGNYRVGLFERFKTRKSFDIDDRVRVPRAIPLRGIALKAGFKNTGLSLFYSSSGEISGSILEYSIGETLELSGFGLNFRNSPRALNAWGFGFIGQGENLRARILFSRNNEPVFDSSNRNFLELNFGFNPVDKTEIDFALRRKESGFFNPAGEVFSSSESVKYSMEVNKSFEEKWNLRLQYAQGEIVSEDFLRSLNQLALRLSGNPDPVTKIIFSQYYRSFLKAELASVFNISRSLTQRIENQARLEYSPPNLSYKYRFLYAWDKKSKIISVFEYHAANRNVDRLGGVQEKIAFELKNKAIEALDLFLRWEIHSNRSDRMEFTAVYFW